MDNRFSINVAVNKSEIAYAQILNEMADYLESNEPAPNHWEEGKREDFYRILSRGLSIKAIMMVKAIVYTKLENSFLNADENS